MYTMESSATDTDPWGNLEVMASIFESKPFIDENSLWLKKYVSNYLFDILLSLKWSSSLKCML